MLDQEERNRQLVQSYLNALADGVVGEKLSKFFTPDATQIEFPNSLNPKGGQSDLTTILLRAEQGQKLISKQTYEVQSVTAEGSRVAVEATWVGILATSVEPLEQGSMMRAHFSIHFEMRDGLIAKQRNYDCFEPW